MKVLVLGLNPSKKGRKAPTLKVLDKWLEHLDVRIVSFDNIYMDYGSFSLKDVDEDYVKNICFNYEKIVSLGEKASHLLRIVGIDHFKLPHPSGLNRQLNNKEYVEKQLNSCYKYLHGDLSEIL